MMTNARKPGDWNCGSCDHHNFSRRDSCQRCGKQKPMPSGLTTCGSEFLPGDWNCWSCGTHNYASRSNCFKCPVSKDQLAGESSGIITGWKSGDWLCMRYVMLLFLLIVNN